MGVDPDHGWRATYEVLPGKEKVVGELKRLAGKTAPVYLATDLDRGGARRSPGTSSRRWAATPPASAGWCSTRSPATPSVKRSSTPRPSTRTGVNAQQARRFLDRVVGFEVSPPALDEGGPRAVGGAGCSRWRSGSWSSASGRSAPFEPEEYWEVFADLTRARRRATAAASRSSRPTAEPSGPATSGRRTTPSRVSAGSRSRSRGSRTSRRRPGPGGAVHHLDPAAGRLGPPRLRGCGRR